MENKFRLDKSTFKATTAKDADNHIAYWKDKTPKQRLEAAFYLINQLYQTTNETLVDRTIFSPRKRH